MKTNRIIREQIFEVIKNQIRDNNPPETKQTLDRLKKDGFSDLEARELIGMCITIELFDIMKNKKVFNEKRYIQNLQNLPAEPTD